MKWTDEMRDIIRSNYPQKTYKEIGLILGVSHRSIGRQLYNMGLTGLSKKERHHNRQSCTKVGCRRRANNKYNAILSRLNATTRNKNKAYVGVELRVTREDFIAWYMPLDFEGASVDRIDKRGHYELSNMQVIPLKENIRKDKIKEHEGMCECCRCHIVKPLSDFSKDKRRLSGYSTICIECERQRGREKYKRLYSKKNK